MLRDGQVQTAFLLALLAFAAGAASYRQSPHVAILHPQDTLAGRFESALGSMRDLATVVFVGLAGLALIGAASSLRSWPLLIIGLLVLALAPILAHLYLGAAAQPPSGPAQLPDDVRTGGGSEGEEVGRFVTSEEARTSYDEAQAERQSGQTPEHSGQAETTEEEALSQEDYEFYVRVCLIRGGEEIACFPTTGWLHAIFGKRSGYGNYSEFDKLAFQILVRGTAEGPLDQYLAYNDVQALVAITYGNDEYLSIKRAERFAGRDHHEAQYVASWTADELEELVKDACASHGWCAPFRIGFAWSVVAHPITPVPTAGAGTYYGRAYNVFSLWVQGEEEGANRQAPPPPPSCQLPPDDVPDDVRRCMDSFSDFDAADYQGNLRACTESFKCPEDLAETCAIYRTCMLRNEPLHLTLGATELGIGLTAIRTILQAVSVAATLGLIRKRR